MMDQRIKTPHLTDGEIFV